MKLKGVFKVEVEKGYLEVVVFLHEFHLERNVEALWVNHYFTENIPQTSIPALHSLFQDVVETTNQIVRQSMICK